MEAYENFKSRSNFEEAANLVGQLPANLGTDTYNCYCFAYRNCDWDTTIMKQRAGLVSVYVLGFLSGSRAIREREKAKHNAKKC